MTTLPPDWAAGLRILVLGDVMLDGYVTGKTSRISEESPVPVLRQQTRSFAPGGAANVAVNITSLGGQATLIGVIGDDDQASRLQALVASHINLDSGALVRDANRPTTTKTRYLSGQHQMLRVDHESIEPVSTQIENALISAARKALPDCGALILSDYAKGALTDRVLAEVITAAHESGVMVIIDPKRTDWSAYKGAHYITPNRKELERATNQACDNDETCAAAAALAQQKTGADILLTRSQHGMSLFRKNAPPLPSPARALEVFDVTGAGDTVAAVFTLALAAGRTPQEAMTIANAAAGVVVTRQGAAQTTPAELAAALQNAPATESASGAISLDEAITLRGAWRAKGLKVGFANGCFDLLHPGHLHLIDQAAAACDRLILAINSDASVSRLKGAGRPVQPASVRAAILAAVRGVDAVITFADDTPLAAIQSLQPDLLIKGEDYEETDIVGADIVRAAGGRILRARLLPGHSTTATVRTLHNNDREPSQNS